MIPWEQLDSTTVPGTNQELRLCRRGGEFSIRVAGCELMNSRRHGSEEAMAELASARLVGRPSPCLLIGGLGMGFTTATALQRLPADGRLVVAELVPAVVAWNRGVLAHLAGHPLADLRVTVCEADVAQLLRQPRQEYDAILLDVDNGPDGLTRPGNDWLYGKAGLAAVHGALRLGGLLAVWSAAPDQRFSDRLAQAGFTVTEHRVQARGRHGSRHTIWLAERKG